jgi:hypothetical protein
LKMRSSLKFSLIYSYVCTHKFKKRLMVSKEIPLQTWTGPEGSRRLRLPGFLDNRHMEVVRLSALRTCRLYP